MQRETVGVEKVLDNLLFNISYEAGSILEMKIINTSEGDNCGEGDKNNIEIVKKKKNLT